MATLCLSSSPSSADSVALRCAGDSGIDGVLTFRIDNDCSLDGGAGGTSGSNAFAVSPKGPSGPSESSIASNCVGCAPTLREERACFPGVALLVDEVDMEVNFGVSGFGVASGSISASFEFQGGNQSEQGFAPFLAFSAVLESLALGSECEGTSASHQQVSRKVGDYELANLPRVNLPRP